VVTLVDAEQTCPSFDSERRNLERLLSSEQVQAAGPA
jgi:hypothetical protein